MHQVRTAGPVRGFVQALSFVTRAGSRIAQVGRETATAIQQFAMGLFGPRADRSEVQLALLDGTPAVVRPVRPSDAEELARALDRLSLRSRQQRFLFPKRKLSRSELHYLTHCDGVQHLALVLAVTNEGRTVETPAAIARCIRTGADGDRAEVAIVVADEWQGRGVGTALLKELARRARRVGIRFWRGLMWADNRLARQLLEEVGSLEAERPESESVVEVVYRLDA